MTDIRREKTPAPPATNQAGTYDVIGRYVAEIYDQAETQRDDVALVKSLIGDTPTKILEPFCGHGRMLIPLVEAGHEVAGLDLSEQLLRSLDERLQQLPDAVQARASYRRSDVIADPWPRGYDVVILGANCLYELATPEEQEHCIAAAAQSLIPGGHLYLDNGHMEGELDPSWRGPGVEQGVFPTGTCRDGTQINATRETVWYDARKRLVRFRRTATILTTSGDVLTKEWTLQKHPPSTQEMSVWMEKHGFVIEELWGDRHRTPYTDDSGRAIFWARRDKNAG